MKRSRQAAPWSPNGISVPEWRCLATTRGQGIHHEHYDLRFGPGKTSIAGALG
jgi:hypothetical protein